MTMLSSKCALGKRAFSGASSMSIGLTVSDVAAALHSQRFEWMDGYRE